MPTEHWCPVLGWEGRYEVSDRGRVRSLPHDTVSVVGVRRHFPGKLLKPIASHAGYQQVNLKASLISTAAHIHTLVLEAFVGPRPVGMHGCHNDGNPTNNSVDNLRWDTPAANARDAVRHGTHRNTRATHCKNGHPKTDENTYVDHLGRRICHPCNKEWRRNRAALKKAGLA